MSTLHHPHVTWVWGDIPIGLGTRVRTFKPSSEAFQAVGECSNHLHHVHHFEITISTSWWLKFLSPFVISWSCWPLITCLPQCSQFMTVGSGVPLKSAVMTHMVCSRTSLRSWKRFFSSFRPNHRLITGLVQYLLVNHILLLLRLHFLSIRGSYHRFFSFHKLHILGYFDTWTAFFSLSQSAFI